MLQKSNKLIAKSPSFDDRLNPIKNRKARTIIVKMFLEKYFIKPDYP
jgi:hypothetical protein